MKETPDVTRICKLLSFFRLESTALLENADN